MGFLEKNVVIGNALIDMYAKCGVLGKALEIFKELPVHDVISWNALIGGYAQHDLGHGALKCFQMEADSRSLYSQDDLPYLQRIERKKLFEKYK